MPLAVFLVFITIEVSTTYAFRIFSIFFVGRFGVYIITIRVCTNYMHYLDMDDPECRRNWAIVKFLVGDLKKHPPTHAYVHG